MVSRNRTTTGCFYVGGLFFNFVSRFSPCFITAVQDFQVRITQKAERERCIGCPYTGLAVDNYCSILFGKIQESLVHNSVHETIFIGIPTLKLREDYLAITTIGIAETIRLVFNNEQWLANGPRGLMGLPQPLQEWINPRDYNYLYLVIVILILVVIYLAIERAIRSPWGRVLRAIREDEISTAMSGKDIFYFKMQSLILGSMIMGIGGALYAHYTKSISPDVFTPLYGTFIIWVMIIVGGSGNNKGAILGAFVVWGIWIGTKFMTDLLPYTLKARAPYIRFLLIGILLEFILIYRPQGLLGEEKRVSKMIE